MQMICALLVFRSRQLPAALTELSPWLDMRLVPLADVVRRLQAQSHRRFIKTHIPLDGLELRADVTYIVVGRDPRDVAVSMSHHRRNINSTVIEERLGLPTSSPPSSSSSDDEAERLRRWLFSAKTPAEDLSTYAGTVWHLEDAWQRRFDPNVILMHYEDLVRDLPGQMTTLCGHLGIDIGHDELRDLAEAATFENMKANAPDLVPDEGIDLLKDPAAFFRGGASGEWRVILDPTDQAEVARRLEKLEPDLRSWLTSSTHGR